jgi:Tetracyclin repressor-like, C-terminal domain
MSSPSSSATRTPGSRTPSQSLAQLEQAGFPDDVSFHAGHVLDAWIVAYSLWLAGHPLTSGERAAVAERLERDKPFDDSPLFLKHHDQHASPGPHQDVSAFEVGLDLILEGLKGSAPTKRRSAASA